MDWQWTAEVCAHVQLMLIGLTKWAAAHKMSGSGHIRRCQTVAELNICCVCHLSVSFDTSDAKC